MKYTPYMWNMGLTARSQRSSVDRCSAESSTSSIASELKRMISAMLKRFSTTCPISPKGICSFAQQGKRVQDAKKRCSAKLRVPKFSMVPQLSWASYWKGPYLAYKQGRRSFVETGGDADYHIRWSSIDEWSWNYGVWNFGSHYCAVFAQLLVIVRV